MKKEEQIFNLGNLEIRAIIEIVDGEALDTEMKIGDKNLCWISGKQRLEFMKEMNSVIEKFRI